MPAAEAEFPLLDDVLADIGDQQSIAESLSSFSGHLLHVKNMLEHVTPNSLVLLDELGRATDPEEGGALGVAMLDEFRKSGAFCLASTHLLPLKLYGAKTEGVLNASMGFDEASLQPTYQLRLGAPGKSAGLGYRHPSCDCPNRCSPTPVPFCRACKPIFRISCANLQRQVDANTQREAELGAAIEQSKQRQADLEKEAAQARAAAPARMGDRNRKPWSPTSKPAPKP